MNAPVKEPTVAWIDVGAVTDIPRCGARKLPSPMGDVAVFRTGDNQVYALMDVCPHKQGPLSQGIVHGRSVTCPLHNRVIDLATGEGVGVDKGMGCAPVVPVEVREGRVLLGMVGT